MGLACILERVGLADLDLDRARADDLEQLAGGLVELLARRRVVHQRGPGQIQASLLAEHHRVDRRRHARGVAEDHHHAAHAQAIERSVPGREADAVVDHRDALAVGQIAHALGEVFLGVDDRVVAAVGHGELGLLVAAHGADHGRTKVLQPLAGDGPDAAGRGVEQHRHSRLDPEGAADQVLCGQALQHHRGGVGVVDAVRGLEELRGRRDSRLRIGADRSGAVANPVADAEIADLGADRLDHAGGLEAEPRRQRHLVGTGAVIDVDEVEADGGMLQPNLASAGGANLDVLPGHYLGAAVAIDADRFGHGIRFPM